jgi:PAS domain S-box-containing protein
MVYMQRITEELSRVKDLLRNHPQGMSITDIARKLGKNKHSVGRYLDILHASGYVDLRTFGMAKVFTLSSRVPLSALLSYTTDLVMVVDQNMRIIQVNEPFLSLTALDQEQVIYQDIQFIPAPDPAVLDFLSIIAGQIRLKQDLEEVELHTTPKGFFHLRIIPTVFDDGTAGTTVILEDITTEHEAHEEISKSREFFRDMISHMTDGLLVVEDGEFLFINNRICEITGYSREEISALDPVCLAAESEQKRLICKFQAMEDQVSSLQDIRFWAVRKDGESRYLYVRMSAHQYGDKLRHYILVTDMTEWRRREEEQELQWTIMRTVVDQLPHPICCYREDGLFFLGNGAFCKIFGCNEADMAGKNLQDLLPPSMYASFVSGDRELCLKGGSEDRTILVEAADGRVFSFPVQKTIVSIGEGSGVYIFCVILTECPDIPAA